MSINIIQAAAAAVSHWAVLLVAVACAAQADDAADACAAHARQQHDDVRARRQPEGKQIERRVTVVVAVSVFIVPVAVRAVDPHVSCNNTQSCNHVHV